MTPEELFEEKQSLVFTAIKQRFGSMKQAKLIAEMNNMELDDFIQIGRMMLWKLCLKYDSRKMVSFEGYVLQAIKWEIYRKILNTGMTIRVATTATWEERQKFVCQSIDLHKDGETVNEYFAISSVNVEEDVINTMEFEELLSVLNNEERSILMQKGYGFSDDEISSRTGKGRATVNRIKNRAFLKVNPDYVPTKQLSLLASCKPIKNHLRQQVI